LAFAGAGWGVTRWCRVWPVVQSNRMTITLSPEIERRVTELVSAGAYPTADAAVTDAIRAWLGDRDALDGALQQAGIDESRMHSLLREAEESGDYTEMTAHEWENIAREGLALLRSRRPR